jgi:hypothetical protein
MERSPEEYGSVRDDRPTEDTSGGPLSSGAGEGSGEDPAEHEAEAARRDPHERDAADGEDGANPAPPGNVQTGTNTGS